MPGILPYEALEHYGGFLTPVSKSFHCPRSRVGAAAVVDKPDTAGREPANQQKEVYEVLCLQVFDGDETERSLQQGRLKTE